MTFTHIQEAGEGPLPLVNEEEVSVVTSPQQFKAFLQLGQRFLDDYEKENGVLNIESNKATPTLAPEIFARLQEAFQKASSAAKPPEADLKASEKPSTNERLQRGTRKLISLKRKGKKP